MSDGYAAHSKTFCVWFDAICSVEKIVTQHDESFFDKSIFFSLLLPWVLTSDCRVLTSDIRWDKLDYMLQMVSVTLNSS